MAGGYHSLLAPWVGGAGAAVAPRVGFRSPLAPWLGGASARTGRAPGFASPLAIWLGGASALAYAPPTPVEPQPPRGGGGAGRGGWSSTQWAPTRRIDIEGGRTERELLEQEDDLMLHIIIQAVTRGLL